MRQSRLLSILLMLQARGRMTAQELADEFEISIRTLYRDIDQLSAAGVPVYADRGRDGGFQLLDGYRTRLTGLTPAEAEALFLSGLPGPASDLGLGDAVAAAQLKLMAALPAEKRNAAARVAGRFYLDLVGWFQHAQSKVVLPALATAVWNARRIRIRYERRAGVVERELEPLGLALKAGIWYLVARAVEPKLSADEVVKVALKTGKPAAAGIAAKSDSKPAKPAAKAVSEADANSLRTYRIAAIQTLDLTEDTFTRPKDFDLAAYWTAAAKAFETSVYTAEAKLRLSPQGMKRLEKFTPAVVEMAIRTKSIPDKAGWTHITIPIESIDHAAGEVLKLGAEAEVLEPSELRQKMAEIAEGMGRVYAAGS
jgi:predicted DNA-binding transcriptional regulator YafY